jgi:hypothetical protein
VSFSLRGFPPPKAIKKRISICVNLRNLWIKIFGFNFAPWRLGGSTFMSRTINFPPLSKPGRTERHSATRVCRPVTTDEGDGQ